MRAAGWCAHCFGCLNGPRVANNPLRVILKAGDCRRREIIVSKEKHYRMYLEFEDA